MGITCFWPTRDQRLSENQMAKPELTLDYDSVDLIALGALLERLQAPIHFDRRIGHN